MSLHAIILAAGRSRRMGRKLPKALVKVGGKSMLAHLLTTVRALQPERLSVVVQDLDGPVRRAFASQPDIHWVEQSVPLGTGPATVCALRTHAGGRALILYVDAPLVRLRALNALLSKQCDIAVLSAEPADPSGFGRMITNSRGDLVRIVEDAHASASEKRIRLVNTGITAAQGKPLLELLEAMPAPDPGKERYLHDMLPLARHRGLHAQCVLSSPCDGALGANTPEQLADLERLHRQRPNEMRATLGATGSGPGP